jgi:hypothetical protein
MKPIKPFASSGVLPHVLGLLITVISCSQVACANGILRPGDSVWEVSTRHLGPCPSLDAPLRVSALVGCAFQPSDLPSLLSDPVAQTAPRTIIYVHGNWMEWGNARDRGLMLYRLLVKRSPEPVRLILFTWPSERTDWPTRDVREKADLADAHAFYLADFINHFPVERPLSLMGFSFGGAMACGALHLLAGGTLQGRAIPLNAIPHTHIHVGLTAPAFERSQLGPHGKYSMALTHIERLVNLYNSSDPVLRRFRFMDRSNPVAAGFSGIDARATQPLDTHPRIVQFDCSPGTGRTHFEVEYYNDCACFRISLDNALGVSRLTTID